MWFESRDNWRSGTYKLFIPKILTLWWLGNENRQDPKDTLFLSFTCPTVQKQKPHKDNHTQAYLLFMHVNHALYIQWFPGDLGFSFARETSKTLNACPGPTSAPAAHNRLPGMLAWRWRHKRLHPISVCAGKLTLFRSFVGASPTSVRIMTCMQKLCCSQGVCQGRNFFSNAHSRQNVFADYDYAWIISHTCNAFCKTFTATGWGKKPQRPFLSTLTKRPPKLK